MFKQNLARESYLWYRLDGIDVELSDGNLETTSEVPEAKFAIFVLSTFGEGNSSRKTASLWECRSKDSSKSL
ncbi:hypothetical protein F4860DRAFT_477845 [Xylaria cubensis]|nr:hypothetical protein F4860DRAFT_477845 [Xylaria cubensis]